jgi:gliding motility-associated-like protein
MGDGASYSTPTAVHTYAGAGTRTVSVTIRPTVGSPISLTKQVYITQMPRTFLGNDSCKDTLELCSGTTVIDAFKNLPQSKYPNPSNLSVTWFPNGEITDKLVVNQEGCYSVKIKDNISGCYSEARINVVYCALNQASQTGINTSVFSYGNGTKIQFTDGNISSATSDLSTLSPAGSSALSFPPIKAAINDLEGIFTNGNLVKTYSGRLLGNLGGDVNLSQATAILPKQSCSGCNSEYYIFGMKQVGGVNQLFYSVFDISGNGGNGSLVRPFSSASIATPIGSFSATDKLVVTPAPLNSFWIHAFEKGSNKIYRYKLDSLGLSKPERIIANSSISFSSFSNLSFSRDSVKLAMANQNGSLNEIFLIDHNKATGDLDFNTLTRINVASSPRSVYGVAFSPDRNILYVTTRGNGSTISSQILQFDLSATNIEASKLVVWDTMDLLGQGFIDYFNPRLYFVIENTQKLAFIRLPNTPFTSLAIPSPSGNFDINDLSTLFSLPSSSRMGRGFTLKYSPECVGCGGDGISQECKGTTFTYRLPEPPKCKDDNKKITGANWFIYRANNYIPGTKSPNLFYDRTIGAYKQVATLPLEAQFLNKMSINYSYPDVSPNPKLYVIVVQVLTRCGSYYLDAKEFEIRNLKPFSLRSRVDKLFDPGDPTCLNRNITFPDAIRDKVPGLSGLTYEWSTGANTPTITVNTEAKYSVKISDNATGCEVKGDIDLRYYAKQNFIPKVAPSVCMDNPTRLLELRPIPNPASLEFLWTEKGGFPLGTNPSLNVTYATKYYLRVRDEYGCTFNEEYTVADKCLPVVLAPNIFTPNGDKVNDRFVPQPLNAARTEIKGVKIFNRWGELLFEVNNNNPDEQWDGTYKGKRVPQDTYVYAIEYISTPTNFPEIGTQTLTGGVLVAY